MYYIISTKIVLQNLCLVTMSYLDLYRASLVYSRVQWYHCVFCHAILFSPVVLNSFQINNHSQAC